MAKSTGNKKFICKFCGQEFVRFAGNIRGHHRYDYCSKRCAMLARYKEHHSTPYPTQKELLTFWNDPENKLWIDRTIAGFIHRHPKAVRPIEVNTEAMLIVAGAMRFTTNRKKIISRLKHGLYDFWIRDICGITHTRYQRKDFVKVEIDEEIDSIEYEIQHLSPENEIDLEYFRAKILESELKCMRILECFLKDMPRADIRKKYGLKRDTDVDTHIRNAISALKNMESGEYDKPKEKLYPLFEKIKQDRLNGMSLRSLARVYDVSKSTMSKFLKKYGIFDKEQPQIKD